MLRKLKKIIEKPRLRKDAAPVTVESATENPAITNSHSSSESIEEISTPRALESNANTENQIAPFRGTQVAVSAQNHAISPNHQFQNVQAQNMYQFNNCQSLHFGPTIINNDLSKLAGTSQAASAKRVPKRKVKTTSIDAMMKCDDRLDPDTMNIIAENLGEGWRNVIRQLGFLDGRIEQMHEDHHVKGIREVIYQFLREWNESDENATLGTISTLLWKDHWEVVYLLKEHWKANRQKNGDSEKSVE